MRWWRPAISWVWQLAANRPDRLDKAVVGQRLSEPVPGSLRFGR